MHCKCFRLFLMLVALVVFANTAFVEDETSENDEQAATKMITILLNGINDESQQNEAILRDTVNSDPEKYFKILNKVKGKFSTRANKIALQFILGLEKYNESKDFISKIGEIVNYDFKDSQLAIATYRDSAHLGWLMLPRTKEELTLMSKTLKQEKYSTQNYEYKFLDWRTIFEEDSGKYRGQKDFDSFYVAADMGLWSWIALCKEDYISAGLAFEAAEQIMYKREVTTTQTQPTNSDWIKHGKLKVQEILADYKLKQIKESHRFDKSFDYILKALRSLNSAFTAKSETKTAIEKLTQQFEKTQKFLDETSTDAEKNKPLNKLLHLIINTNINCPDPRSLFRTGLGGYGSKADISDEDFPINFVKTENETTYEIWDLLGDFLPQDYAQLFNLLDCEYVSRGFFNVQDYLSLFLSYFNTEMSFFWDNAKLTRKEQKKYFAEMPANRLEFYTELHQTILFLRTFAINELAQTNYNDTKKILLELQNVKNFNKLFEKQLSWAHADTNKDILRQFSVFLSYTNKDNYDETFFKQVFASKFNDNVLYVLAEMIWGKFQSTIGFERLAEDLDNQKVTNNIGISEIKARIYLLQVMSHTSKDLADKFKKLMLKLMESKNDKVQFAIFQIFEKYGVPDSFVENVRIACDSQKILFEKPDVDSFPMMISNLAMSIIASKNEMSASYRVNASYFDRRMMFEFILKFMDKDNNYDELLNKYKVEKEDVPEDLSGLKQIIEEYLNSSDAKQQNELRDQILKSLGAWDALRLSGRHKTDAELQKLLALADAVSRKIKVIEHLTDDNSDDKLTAELDTLKGKSISYMELTELAKSLAIKFNLKEAAVYAERLANGIGTRLMIYTVKSSEDLSENTGFEKILAAKYTRNGISKLSKSTDFSDVKGENVFEDAIEGVSNVSIMYITSQFEFFYHIKR